MISALDELPCQYHPHAFVDRQQAEEEKGVGQMFERADRLIDKLDMLCVRVELLIANSNRERGLGIQTKATCAQRSLIEIIDYRQGAYLNLRNHRE